MSTVHVYFVAVATSYASLIDCQDCKTVPVTTDASSPDIHVADTGAPPDVGPGEVWVSRTHWKLVFEDDFRGPTGKPSDSYCFDTLEPQCHIWSGGNFDCDLEHDTGTSPIPPLKANLVAAIKLFEPNHDFANLSLPEVKAIYSRILRDRLADLDKCTWTAYMMVNWMATDYAGHWSARMDPTQIEVDASGKGVLRLFATRAPVEASCIFGGSGGNPNCQIHGFAPGVLTQGVSYWVDPDPRWPGVYYAPVNGGCPYGGTFTGVNCSVYGFPPNVLEAKDVPYWVDADPRWPGVYYANRTYACRDNIDYAPTLGFRNLTCPILNGALMSYPPEHNLYTDPSGTKHEGGVAQLRGRFEAKAKIPKGLGAFPATWLMPLEGGWPYDGGEIDVMEARDNADEVYQTFHSGRCYNPSTNVEMDATDNADCVAKGGKSTHMSKGFTIRERQASEFWQRHHLFAVEWSDVGGGRLEYFINNVKTGTINVGDIAKLTEGAPASLGAFSDENFPTSPFYWILNHSTWVAPDRVDGWAQQVFEIDYIKNYVACDTTQAEFCPEGGNFTEGVGCTRRDGTVYPSPCQPSVRPCVNGGEPDGSRCRAWAASPGLLVPGVAYWADSDPRYPGIYYAPINGGCPYGGGLGVNCQVVGLADDVLEPGVRYTVDASAATPGIYYTPDFR